MEDVACQAHQVGDDLVSWKMVVELNNAGGNDKNHFDNVETVLLFDFIFA